MENKIGQRYLTVSEFIEGFAKGTLGNIRKHKNWHVELVDDQMELYFHNKHSGVTKLQYTGKLGVEKGRYYRSGDLVTENVAYRYPDGSILYNANVLMVATRKANGVALHNHERADCQIYFDSIGAKPLPFTIFKESGSRDDVAILNLKIIKQGEPETVYRKTGEYNYNRETKKNEEVINQEHFVGAAIYKIDNQFFLFDYDRKEQKENKIFNPFIVELPKPAYDFDEAYMMLMPHIVMLAKFKDIPVQRQGEFFFIYEGEELPVKIELTSEEEQIIRYPPSRSGFLHLRSDADRWHDHLIVEKDDGQTLTSIEQEYNEAAARYWEVRNRVDQLIPVQVTIGGMSHHTASSGVRDAEGRMYVTGLVRHSNREHGDLHLAGWWQVVPNTAVKSVTIQGRID